MDGVFRISTRQRLIFDYFKYDKDRRETLSQDLSAGGVTVPSGSFIKGELKYQVATFVYDYSVIDSPEFSLGLQIGAEYAKVEANAYADLGTLFSGDVLTKAKTALRRSSVSASPRVPANTGCSMCRASTSTPVGATSATTMAT